MSLLKSHQWGNTFGAAAVFSLMLGLSGCGSSGGSGSSDDTGDSGGDNTGSINEQAATIQTEEDAEQGAVATVESAQQAILDDNASGILPTGVAIKEDGHHQWLIDHSIAMAEQATMPTGAVYTIDGNCGGSATVNYNEDFSDYTIDYNNYCSQAYQNQPYVIDGYIDFFGWDNRDSEWGYRFDYTSSYQGQTSRAKGTYRCNGDNYSACSLVSDYEGKNGRQYRSENTTVSQSNGTYNVSGRVYDQEMGYVDYQASNLTLCENGYGFSTGSIRITDSTGSNVVTVNFSGCSTYTVTYQGVGYTFSY